MLRTPGALRSLATRSIAHQQVRCAHAISNPTLAAIERRWPDMPPQEQAQIWMDLRDRMKADWRELTPAEKRAGPRAAPPPGETATIIWQVSAALVVSGVVFGVIRYFARGPPSTMNKEWQEATEAYLKEQNIEPITGISNPNFKGNFSVQSPPKQ